MSEQSSKPIEYENVPSYEIGILLAGGWFACLMLIFIVGMLSESLSMALNGAMVGGILIAVVSVVQKWRDGGFTDAR